MAEYNTVTADITVSNSIVVVGTSVGTDVHRIDYPEYDGDTEITPDWTPQILNTKDHIVREDITVKSIQLESVSNTSGGRTVYIGGII